MKILNDSNTLDLSTVANEGFYLVTEAGKYKEFENKIVLYHHASMKRGEFVVVYTEVKEPVCSYSISHIIGCTWNVTCRYYGKAVHFNPLDCEVKVI
jgi:hypothetical protein